MAQVYKDRYAETHREHRRIIDQACQIIQSRHWKTKNNAIDQIFDLYQNDPRLSKFHKAQISGLLAKYGDDTDIEIAEYALECIKIARQIIRKENLPEGSNGRQAVEDLVWDALDTLKARASEIEVSDNMAQYLRNLEQVGGRVTEYDDDDDEEEEEEEEESDDSDEEENDTEMELDGGEGNMKLQTSQAINITVSSLPAFPYSGNAKALEKSITLPGKLRLPANYGVQHFADPDMDEVNINMRHEDLKLVGLFLLLVLDDPREMEAMVLSYAISKNLTIMELADMMTNAYGPREKTHEEIEMETQMQTTLPPPALTRVFFQPLALRPRELLEGAEAMQEEEQL